MTQRVQVLVECDPCQIENPENLVPAVTREITIDGSTIEVDACDLHGKQIDLLLDWLVDVGRVIPTRGRRAKLGTKTTAPGDSAECPACDYVAPNLASLRTHARGRHGGMSVEELAGTATIPCPDCDRRFGSNQGLAQHRRQNHGYVASP